MHREMFDNAVRKQGRKGMLPPTELKQQQILKVEGVHKTRG